ncbi:MAG: Xaa-Pro peptidase family protein [Pseudomonadota bacterium]
MEEQPHSKVQPDWTPADRANKDHVDEAEIRRYRLQRVREQLQKRDLAGLLLCDPINIRYATGSRNMQVWTMHNLCRYAYLANGGPLVLFELPTGFHLAKGLEGIDEIRPSLTWDYLVVGERNRDFARLWAQDILDLVTTHGGGNRRVAVDRADYLAVQALLEGDLQLQDGKGLMEHARAIKSHEEIYALRHAKDACADAVASLKAQLKPGLRESDALAILAKENVARGGEYMETRLLTSGPRTNPWFQETADRVMEKGDLLSFDTDLIGPYGFYADMSRSWVMGDQKPSDAQRRIYALSNRQLQHNIELLRPGVTFREFSEKAFVLPEPYLANRYADLLHGCGLAVEYPFILYPEDADQGGHDGHFEAGMVICMESYVGAENGPEGVKLEQPVLITDQGPVLLTDCPLEDSYL